MSRYGGPGPLSLLAGCLLPVLGAFAIESAPVGVAGLVAEAAAFGWLVTDVRWALHRLAFGVLAAGGIGLTTWLYAGQSLAAGGAAASRVLYLVAPSAVLTPLVRPSALGDHLAQRLHLPARAVVAATASLQRVDSLTGQWRQIQRARRARGMGIDGSPLRRARASTGSAFALLVVALRQSGVLALAMDVRGFAGASQRSWAEPAPWWRRDTAVLVSAIGLAVLPWLLR